MKTLIQPASQPRQRAQEPKTLAPFSPGLLSRPADLFRFLTRWTIPHGYEGKYYHKALTAMGFTDDQHGNYFLTIGKEPQTAFMAHLDTANPYPDRINQIVTEGVCRTDGTSILGADDRAGVTLLLHMASMGIAGRYCLFVGEEVGCIGSTASAQDTRRWAGVKRAVSFDRRGKTSVVTHQCGRRTCSEEFALALAGELNRCSGAVQRVPFSFAPDSTGVYTDSLEFAGIVPECTNLSVGYEGAHSPQESQCLGFLSTMARACCLVDWNSLPAIRVPKAGDRHGWFLAEEEEELLTLERENEAIDLLVRQFQSGEEFDARSLDMLCEGDWTVTVRMEALLLACRSGIYG